MATNEDQLRELQNAACKLRQQVLKVEAMLHNLKLGLSAIEQQIETLMEGK